MTYTFTHRKFMIIRNKESLNGYVMWREVGKDMIEVRQVVPNPVIRDRLKFHSLNPDLLA